MMDVEARAAARVVWLLTIADATSSRRLRFTEEDKAMSAYAGARARGFEVKFAKLGR
jgi:hypothetical protein